jgi:hypothetical protein
MNTTAHTSAVSVSVSVAAVDVEQTERKPDFLDHVVRHLSGVMPDLATLGALMLLSIALGLAMGAHPMSSDDIAADMQASQEAATAAGINPAF